MQLINNGATFVLNQTKFAAFDSKLNSVANPATDSLKSTPEKLERIKKGLGY
ncbi:hypothetical protein [Convivina praedatoris]|uniref:Uncharacterized protein n=1 Tax=Convivina praedatoris TaxID=2880963 RepID=A0ABN8HAG8_9LACO|nr:hypothetical protein [Convivina sp. LMG 32447]CAH1856017.1 hypothetical protein R077815_01341 [Convivina sp. LMG 32447]CAH1856454.1 hypothetical protein LMG032447_01289 [Convivina sp. LMG 32447]CAH1857344.1 hypothetical protein R078138_01569 [Convivina sp. LMG 32447]